MSEPRLRFDKVATGLVERVRRAVRGSVPAGKTVAFTVTAPIRLPAKTAAAIEERILSALARRSIHLDVDETIHGNRVRIALIPGDAPDVSNVIGLVHNPGPNTRTLLETARSLMPTK